MYTLLISEIKNYTILPARHAMENWAKGSDLLVGELK
jgi:hypothetical protein